MDRFSRLLAGLLGRAARLLPGRRREWAEAALAESGEVACGGVPREVPAGARPGPGDDGRRATAPGDA
jgi:hypothetical protein